LDTHDSCRWGSGRRCDKHLAAALRFGYCRPWGRLEYLTPALRFDYSRSRRHGSDRRRFGTDDGRHGANEGQLQEDQTLIAHDYQHFVILVIIIVVVGESTRNVLVFGEVN